MSFLSSALKLAEQGFYVFPLLPGKKTPLIEDFTNRATRDREQIKKFWTDPVLGTEKDYNIGISTTRYNGSQALIVVDVDDKGLKRGSDEVLKLELSGYDFIDTTSQRTPSGGRHFIYRSKAPVKQGTSVLAPGLDIRSKGGYIAAAGSVIDGKAYVWEDKPIAVCPDWIITRCQKPMEKEPPVETASVDSAYARKRAIFYLENEAPLAIEGANGDQTTFKVAARLKDLGISEKEAYELLLSEWNESCSPPWGPEELLRKIKNAYNYGSKAPGTDAPEAQFTAIDEISESNYLEQINKTHALVFNMGEHFILHETIGADGAPEISYMTEATFKRKFSPHTVVQGRGRPKTFAEVWLDWRGRRTYQGICFSPEKENKFGYYNLWKGFRYKPTKYSLASEQAREGFHMFMEHALKNVCDNDEKLYLWLMGYFAHMIQKPYERPLTTLVFKGSKGTGKNALIERIGKLIGNKSFLVAHNSRYLTSNFNGHLESCLCLVLDEAFWSGDKSAEGVLKGLSTSDTILIERKGCEPYTSANLARIVIIGNEEWLAPASADERRYAVFNVGEGRIRQGAFFEKMRILMDHKGGAEILIDYLKSFDLSTVDINTAPDTIGLSEQKMLSLTPEDEFLFECLKNGAIGNIDIVPQVRISKETFRQHMVAHLKFKNVKGWVKSEESIGRRLNTILKTSIDSAQRISATAPGLDGPRKRCYTFKDLESMRHAWDAYFKIQTKWDD